MLAVIVIGPWLLLLVYDVLLYFWRFATFQLAHMGGRGNHRERPRAPSLRERPDGHKRQISFPSVPRRHSWYHEDAVAPDWKRSSTGSMPRATYDSVEEE